MGDNFDKFLSRVNPVVKNANTMMWVSRKLVTQLLVSQTSQQGRPHPHTDTLLGSELQGLYHTCLYTCPLPVPLSTSFPIPPSHTLPTGLRANQHGVWEAKEDLGEGLAIGGKEGATEMRECSAVQLSGTGENRAREFTQNTAGLWSKLYTDL
ncbi:Ran GTPase-activating protein 2 [Clarias magur]|uniref:Ran GTPase-activating protein 2 n=1 Tax=Clarias magur TaxID=1594786 RepID=A0A8J4XFT4_CLAMG|nr:Ran GTPase-activating protein 2 [Clarias magur]